MIGLVSKGRRNRGKTPPTASTNRCSSDHANRITHQTLAALVETYRSDVSNDDRGTSP